jgi:1,4-dihydroxy-2-naphthoyl-CoA hydrolase
VTDLVAAMPFAGAIGLGVDVARAEEVRGGLDWRTDLCTAAGVLHGGVLMAAADSLGAICAFLNLPSGASTATMESKTNFFRPVRAGRVSGVARPVHVGRSSIVVQTELSDDDGRLVALVIQTQAVLA